MTEPVEKKFTVSYATVQIAGRTFRAQYDEDQAAYEAKDPLTFVPNYSQNFQVKIDLAAVSGTDEEQQHEQSGETIDVSVKVKEGKALFQTLKYWIELTFPNDLSIQERFGFNDYDKACMTHGGFILFYGTLKSMMTTYGAELVTRGCPQTDVDKVATIDEELRAEKTEQQLEIRKRKGETQNRIIRHNDVWDVMSQINKASKIVWPDDYAMQSKYFMPENPGGGGQTEPPPPPNPS